MSSCSRFSIDRFPSSPTARFLLGPPFLKRHPTTQITSLELDPFLDIIAHPETLFLPVEIFIDSLRHRSSKTERSPHDTRLSISIHRLAIFAKAPPHPPRRRTIHPHIDSQDKNMRSTQFVALVLILFAVCQVLSTHTDRLNLSIGPPGSTPGSRASSPSAKGKSPAQETSSVRLFGVNLSEPTSKASTPAHPHQSSAHTHTSPPRPSQAARGRPQAAHPNAHQPGGLKQLGYIGASVHSKPYKRVRKRPSAVSLPQGAQKPQPKSAVKWWNRAGGTPPSPMGTSATYEKDKERKARRMKAKLQGQSSDTHPSGHDHHSSRGAGPGSPGSGAGNALATRGLPGSKSPSPSSPRSKSPSPVRQSRPVKIFGVNINQDPGRPAPSGHPSLTTQAQDQSTHRDTHVHSKGSESVSYPVAPAPKKPSTHKRPSGGQKGKLKGRWWEKAGGEPPKPFGTGARYEEGRRYREKKKLKLQAQNLDHHPSGHPSTKGGGPGSPGTGAGSALTRRASSGSRSPSPSSGRGKSVTDHTRPVKLFGVNINQHSGRSTSPQGSNQATHAHVAHPSHTTQSHDHSFHPDVHAHGEHPVTFERKKRGGQKGIKLGHWWNKKGGVPPKPPGKGSRYETDKGYRERKKMKKQAQQQLDEHPSGLGTTKGKGSGPPDGGGGSGSGLVPRSGPGSPSPPRGGSRGESPAHQVHSTKLFGVTVHQSSKGKAPSHDTHSTKLFGVDLSQTQGKKAAQGPHSTRLFGVDIKQPGFAGHPSPSTHHRPAHEGSSSSQPKGKHSQEGKQPNPETRPASVSHKRPAAAVSGPGGEKKAVTSWWNTPGGLPKDLRPKGPRYEVSKRYREKKKMVKALAQAKAQSSQPHPSAQHPQRREGGGRPGSPGARGALVRRGPGSESRSPSPSDLTQHAESTGLLGDVVRQGTRRQAALDGSQTATHSHPAHVSEGTQAHGKHSMQMAHSQVSGSDAHSTGKEAGRLGHLVAGMRPVKKRPAEAKLPEGVKKAKPAGQWWKRPGGVPPNQAGNSPQGAAQKRYREKQKLLKSGNESEEHGSKHAEHPPKGPGSPGSGSHAVHKRRLKGMQY